MTESEVSGVGMTYRHIIETSQCSDVFDSSQGPSEFCCLRLKIK